MNGGGWDTPRSQRRIRVQKIKVTRRDEEDLSLDPTCTCGGVGYGQHLTWCPVVRGK